MNNKQKVVTALLGFVAAAYTGHHAIILGQDMVRAGQDRIMCMALERRLEDWDYQQTSTSNLAAKVDDYTRILNSICWVGNSDEKSPIIKKDKRVASESRSVRGRSDLFKPAKKQYAASVSSSF